MGLGGGTERSYRGYCEVPMRVFFHGGGEGVEVHGSAAGVRVVEVPTKAPATHLSAAEVGAGVSHPHYEFEPGTGNPLYTEETLPVALQNEFRAETMGRGSNSTVQRRARNVSSKECMYLFLRFVFFCFVFCFLFFYSRVNGWPFCLHQNIVHLHLKNHEQASLITGEPFGTGDTQHSNS